MLSKVNSYICFLCKWISGVLLSAMVLLMVVQVFFRYALNQPLGFPELISTWMLVWVIILAGSIEYRDNKMISVNIIKNKLPNKIKNYLDLIFYLAILVFLWYFMAGGYTLSVRGLSQRIGGLGLPPTYKYSAAVVGGIIYGLITIEKILIIIRKIK